MKARIDPDEDFASWYKDGRDPDRYCERLYLWHRALWGRPVQGISSFELDVVYNGGYGMQLRAADGSQFWLGSDSIIPTWSAPGWTSRFGPNLVAEIGKNSDDFYRVACMIGGYVMFPRNRTGQAGDTINQARGKRLVIADRFDLTLECIRRHYVNPAAPAAENPLGDRLAYYADFFSLFGDFDRYVQFFLLDELVTPDRGAVRSLMTGDSLSNFSGPALPVDPAEYAGYRERSIAFVTARNSRILQLDL